MRPHVTISEIAKVLDCSTKTVRRKVEKGLIPAIQPGGKGTHLRFDLDDVINAVKDNQQAENATDVSAAFEPESEKLPGPMPKWKKQLNQKTIQT